MTDHINCRDDNEVNLFMESMQQEIDMENQLMSDKYGFNFSAGQPSKHSKYDWTAVKVDKMSPGFCKSEVAESSNIKIEKPRMMSVDYGRQSTHDDTVFHTQSD